jgi:hypothetical protein
LEERQIISLPDGLQIIQRGSNDGHLEIAPRQPMKPPVKVTMGAVTTQFYYAPDGNRYARRETGSADGARTVFYVGKDYELVAWDSGMREERSYVGPSVVIYRGDSNAAEVRYRHGDRLNSLDAVTDSSGNEIAPDLHRYDAFGKPRGYDCWISRSRGSRRDS